MVKDIQDGRRPVPCGLDARTEGPFFGVITEESSLSAEDDLQLATLCDFTRELVEHIRQEIRVVEFWRKTHAQQVLRAWMTNHLFRQKIVSVAKAPALAERLMQLARVLHSRLVA